jgi:hypothetical protein
VGCYSPYDYTTMLSFKMTNVKDRKCQHINNSQHIYWLVGWFMVFNATIIDISVISWWSVLLVEETGVPGENHRPVASCWKIYHMYWISILLTLYLSLALFANMSRRGRSEKNQLRVTYDWPYVPANENGNSDNEQSDWTKNLPITLNIHDPVLFCHSIYGF